ncbi:MAG: bifunctional DNA primase/polymerase, partial [Candidatus Paceibacteria bacterium]
MEPQIPPQVREYPLIRVRRPDSSKDGAGKRPVTSVDDDNSLNRIKSWMNRGGNYGVVARSDNDLVIFDSDSTEFSDVLKTELPSTFTVVSGGQGWGEHLYYRCPEADIQSKWSDPEGSMRVRNWHCVGPSSEHPETDEVYEVKSDEPIAEVTIDDLRAVASELNTRSNRQPTRGGGGGSGDPPAAARVGSFSEYPSRRVPVDTAYNWVAGNDLDDRFNRTDKSENGDESADDFVLCKCMAEAGIAAEIITETMTQHRASDAKWHYRDRDYRLETVRNAIEEAVEDSYVDFSDTADMGPDGSERRKTEEFGGSRTQQGG